MVRLAAFIFYGAFVAYVSLLPGGAVSINIWDKFAHFLVYGFFTILAFGVSSDPKYFLFLCLGIVMYSGLLELGQSFVPGRDMSAYDLFANGLGVLMGAVLVRGLLAFKTR